jgi:hypothetical protein
VSQLEFLGRLFLSAPEYPDQQDHPPSGRDGAHNEPDKNSRPPEGIVGGVGRASPKKKQQPVNSIKADNSNQNKEKNPDQNTLVRCYASNTFILLLRRLGDFLIAPNVI